MNTDGELVEVSIDPISNKVDAEQVAHHIAFAVWGELDRSMTSQLWKNFPAKR